MATIVKPRFQTPRNFKFGLKHCTHVSEYSETVPNQSFSIEEILEKFTFNSDPYLTKLPQGEEDLDDVIPTVPDFTDIEDAQIFLEGVKQKVNDLKKSRKKEIDSQDVQPQS